MGFWNKLGKIALQAAPYVAAPFTGGASLMATGATQKLGQKWAEHDYKKAIEKGVAPSKFDKYLGMASTAAGLGSSFTGGFGLGSLGSKAAGTAGKAASTASKVGNTANKLTGWQKNLATAGKVGSLMMGAAPMGQGTATDGGGWQGQLASVASDLMRRQDSGSSGQQAIERNPSEGSIGLANRFAKNAVMPRGGFDYSQNPMNRRDQSTPNLAESIFQGRNEAMRGQPFRGGSTVYTKGDEEGQVITQQLPPMYPQYEEPRQTPIANRFGDELTPNIPTRRKRNPAPVEEEAY